MDFQSRSCSILADLLIHIFGAAEILSIAPDSVTES